MARYCRNPTRFNNKPPSSSSSPRNFAGSGPGHQQGRVVCYKCGGLNHFSRDCKAPDGVKCYNCNGFGHLSRDCPEGPKPQVCYKCQQEGHISRDCPQA
ncbi:hypothetical protein BGX28_006747 [Mortierella sp. GBA30]|nr:hypothetical protein BGX28_006747 [Mortierella sp. GBA30]